MIYWAGDRGFRACTRWHDREAIKALESKGWEVYYPFEPLEEGEDFFGKQGTLRKACLKGIENSSSMVAYLGTYDTGTAQEMEYASSLGRPILAWSDSALAVGQHAGREVVLSQKDLEKIRIPTFPLNGMTAIFDRYVEFSSFNKDVGPQELAEIIDRELRIMLKK